MILRSQVFSADWARMYILFRQIHRNYCQHVEVLFSLQIVDVYLTSSKQTITTSGYANESRAESGRGGLSDFVRLK